MTKTPTLFVVVPTARFRYRKPGATMPLMGRQIQANTDKLGLPEAHSVENRCFHTVWTLCGLAARPYATAMKKSHGLKRAMQPVQRARLEGMTTGALLGRLKRLRWCEESHEVSDLSDEEVRSASGLIMFKDDPAWRAAYTDIREVLATREHVANKP